MMTILIDFRKGRAYVMSLDDAHDIFAWAFNSAMAVVGYAGNVVYSGAAQEI